MKRVLLMPVLAAAMFAAACNSDAATAPDTRASVRFFNATTGMKSGGFTTNGQFATGSALGFGAWSQACTRLDEGVASFGFAAANSTGTEVSGNALASLSNQTLVAGGNYTVVAVGPATKPTLYLFQNNPTNSLAASGAAVRFVNLAPGTDSTANTFVVYNGALGQGAQVGSNIAVGAPTAFEFVTAGSHQYSVLKLPGHVAAVEGNGGVLNLSGGTVYTFAILPQSGSWRLLNIPRCEVK